MVVSRSGPSFPVQPTGVGWVNRQFNDSGVFDGEVSFSGGVHFREVACTRRIPVLDLCQIFDVLSGQSSSALSINYTTLWDLIDKRTDRQTDA